MEKLIVNGETFELIPATSFGDYGGDGSVARANLNVLRDQFKSRMIVRGFDDFRHDGTLKSIYHLGEWVESPASEFDNVDLVILEGGWNSEAAYLREGCEEFADIMDTLSDYPLLDEEENFRVEMEWCDAAIPDAVRDVGRAMREHGEFFEEVWDALDQEQAETAIHEALRNGTGGEVHYEHSSAYIDADAVAKLIVTSWGELQEHRAVKLPDGTLIDLGEVEGDDPTVFDNLPLSSTSAYVAEFCERNHYRTA